MTNDLSTEFNLDENVIYLNHAAVAPWPVRTEKAVNAFCRENVTIGSKKYAHWLTVENRLKNQLAQLINAPSVDEIALVKNTSEALSFCSLWTGLGNRRQGRDQRRRVSIQYDSMGITGKPRCASKQSTPQGC